jgi:hypothetical protein
VTSEASSWRTNPSATRTLLSRLRYRHQHLAVVSRISAHVQAIFLTGSQCLSQLMPGVVEHQAAPRSTMARWFSVLQLAISFLAPTISANPIAGCLHSNPTTSAATIQHHNATGSASQVNLLGGRSVSDLLSTRQASCPDPSTNSLCQPNFCFIYQQNGDGTAWATCCPVGWVLSLNSADWSTQKCMLNGVSEPPLRPVSCGGSINGATGTVSGWACVYSNQNINGAVRTRQSAMLVAALTLSWVGMWCF